MNVDHARTIAAGITRDLARVIDTLQVLVAPEGDQERPDGFSPLQDTNRPVSSRVEELSVFVAVTDEERAAAPEDNPFRGFAHDTAKKVSMDAAEKYDDLAKAVCEATGIVWPASQRGLLHALRALDEEAQGLRAEHDTQLAAARTYRKRWHEAATQRDALVKAAREALDNPRDQFGERDGLRAAVEQVEAGGAATGSSATLRRELWHVLDRMPASDDDLIASVKKLKEEQ